MISYNKVGKGKNTEMNKILVSSHHQWYSKDDNDLQLWLDAFCFVCRFAIQKEITVHKKNNCTYSTLPTFVGVELWNAGILLSKKLETIEMCGIYDAHTFWKAALHI